MIIITVSRVYFLENVKFENKSVLYTCIKNRNSHCICVNNVNEWKLAEKKPPYFFISGAIFNEVL